MKKKLLLLFLLLAFVNGFSQIQRNTHRISVSEVKEALNKTKVSSSILSAHSQALESGITLRLPTPSGKMLTLAPIESSVMSETLASQFPGIKTYRIFDVTSGSLVKGVLTSSPGGINALIFTEEGNIIISPTEDNNDLYYVFYQSNEELMESCDVGHEHEAFGEKKGLRTKAVNDFSTGPTLKTYRLAILTTAEFFTNNGSTQVSALAAVVSMVNSLRAVYEREAGVSFTLVSTKIYEVAASDPFNPAGGQNAFDAALAFGALISSEPANFGLDKYDLGHVLHHSTGGGGVAYLYGPCRNNNLHATLPSPIKGGGWSGGTPSVVATFIHEVGHQFSAGHTFNGSFGSCAGGNFMSESAYEPGSGSTFMSYWGNCAPENISGAINRSYFHANSVESILWYANAYGTCSVNTPTGNGAPVVSTNPNGSSLLIPKGTPFTLVGSGTDPNSHPLLFNWEQYDLGTTRGGAKEAQNSINSPIFRSLAPSSTGHTRVFPSLTSVLGGSIPSTDEALPQMARTINMRLTARDGINGGGGTTSETLALTITNAGPFLITSQNSPTLWLYDGSATTTVNWSVNGTNTAPFNITNVKISFSSDGGETFPHVLVASTPNSGVATVSIPNVITTQGRIKIEPVGNWLFFDINNVNITVSTTCGIPDNISFLPTTNVTEDQGSSNLILSQTILGPQLTSISGTLTSATPNMGLSGKGSSACMSYSNQVPYNAIEFLAPQTGLYTFNFTPYPTILNLYFNSFNPSNPCTNFVSSSWLTATNTVNTSISINLPAGKYVMVLSTHAGSPTLPANYTITSAGLPIYRPIPSPGSPYDFTYVIKSNTNGLIIDFTNSPNLSTHIPGSYTIHALSYQGGLNLTPYIGTSFTSFENLLTTGVVCGKLSTTTRSVTVTGPCPPTLSLNGAATAGISSVINTITSSQVVSTSTNVTYRAGNSIELLPVGGSGFSVQPGAVFKAEIGGCL